MKQAHEQTLTLDNERRRTHEMINTEWGNMYIQNHKFYLNRTEKQNKQQKVNNKEEMQAHTWFKKKKKSSVSSYCYKIGLDYKLAFRGTLLKLFDAFVFLQFQKTERQVYAQRQVTQVPKYAWMVQVLRACHFIPA